MNVTRPSTSDGLSPASPEGVEHGLGGQPQLTATGILGEIGGADTGDGCLAGEHQLSPKVSVDVAMTWLPRLLLPTTFSVTRSPSISVTSPVNVMVS